jgi:hypothetical protein
MIISDRIMDQGVPRKGVKVIKVERATRIVPAYSRELISTGQTWAETMTKTEGIGWPAWERVMLRAEHPTAPTARKADTDPRLPKVTEGPQVSALPKLSRKHCKRLNMDSPILPVSASITMLNNNESLSSTGSMALMTSSNTHASFTDFSPAVAAPKHDRYGSLTDQAWGMFEDSGFDSGKGISQLLQFDLTQSAKEVSASDDCPLAGLS